MASKREEARVFVAQNRKARHDYFIEDKLEAGIMLTGSEVKSARKGSVSIGEAFAEEQKGDFYLIKHKHSDQKDSFAPRNNPIHYALLLHFVAGGKSF